MTTLTEDGIRRRELAGLGINAEVDTDGHNAVVRLSIHDLDRLIAGNETAETRRRRYDAAYEDGDTHGWGEGYDEGHEEGFREGRKAVLADLGRLVDLTPEELASLTPDLPDVSVVRPA